MQNKHIASHYLIVIICLVMAGCFFGCASEYNLATGKEEVLLYSTEKEIKLGRSIARQIEKEYKFDYSQILNKIENINLETKKKILIQLSFQQSDLDITNEILINAKKTQFSSNYYFFEGLLSERKGKNNKAIKFLKKALYVDSTVEQKILSSHKVFSILFHIFLHYLARV